MPDEESPQQPQEEAEPPKEESPASDPQKEDAAASGWIIYGRLGPMGVESEDDSASTGDATEEE